MHITYICRHTCMYMYYMYYMHVHLPQPHPFFSTHTCAHTHARIHTCTHTHTHTHACTHTLGKDDSITSDLGMTAGVVLRLVEPICGLGHHLYTDNLYTSPRLYAELRLRGFEACGTLRFNRRDVPPEAKATLRKGERRAVVVDENMAVVQWHDKRVVSLLSTLHSDTPVQIERRSRHVPGGREVVEKPEAIIEYNKFMGGVDHGDQLLSYYGFPHRTVKWWRREFFFLFDAAIVNSYTMYCTINTRHRSHEQFRITLAKQLLNAASQPCSLPATSSHGPRHQPLQPLARLTERHFPAQMEKSPAGRQLQQNCAVCSNKKGRGRKTTTFKCKQCNIPMCIVPCFELHHTKVDPQRYL